jgi:alpha-glucosidase
MTGRLGPLDVAHEVARAVRRTAEAIRPDALVIGEHNHDATGDVDGDGWHGTMNYSGFSWPLWAWLRSADTPARAFGRPVQVPRRPGGEVLATLRAWQGSLGWRATASSWNILGSHDSARIRTMVGSGAAHRVAAGLQFTLPGVPMVFAGDEIGLEGVLGEDSRRPMPWHRRDEWDHATLATYSSLARVRRSHAALRRGGLRWAHVDDDTLVYVREHLDGDVLVCARRAAGGPVALTAGALGAGTASHLLGTEGGDGGGDLTADSDGVLILPGSDGARLDAWLLG